jgi:hypothetical protein
MKLPVAQNAKAIIAEWRDNVLRPRGGKYFRSYNSKMKYSHGTKRSLRTADRRELKKNLDEALTLLP